MKGLVAFLRDLIDNDTLCILGAVALAVIKPELAGEVITGLFAFMGLKRKMDKQ